MESASRAASPDIIDIINVDSESEDAESSSVATDRELRERIMRRGLQIASDAPSSPAKASVSDRH